MPDLQRWSTLVSLLGGVSLVVGSIDPIEGSGLNAAWKRTARARELSRTSRSPNSRVSHVELCSGRAWRRFVGFAQCSRRRRRKLGPVGLVVAIGPAVPCRLVDRPLGTRSRALDVHCRRGGDWHVVPRITWNDVASHRERCATRDRSSNGGCHGWHRDDHGLCHPAFLSRAT